MELARENQCRYPPARTTSATPIQGFGILSPFPRVPLRSTPGYTPLHLRCFPRG